MIPVTPRNEIKCAVPSCKNKKTENLSISYFTFPEDPDQCSMWINNCGIEGKIDVSKNGSRVCAEHFESHCFLNISKNRLQLYAVPTLLLGTTKNINKTVSSSTSKSSNILLITLLDEPISETCLSFSKPSTSRSIAGMSRDYQMDTPFANKNPDILKSSALDLLLRKKAEDEARKRSLKLRAAKAVTLKKYAPEVRKRVNKIFDELVCENLFEMHMDLKTGMCDPKRFFSRHIPEEPLKSMAEELDIIKGNQYVNCPKCSIVVRCLGLSKHLAVCMNPQQSYSYSSRNSSRIARQRIQEGFKTSNDESKIDSDDEKVKPKKRNNKENKNKRKGVK